MLDEVLLWSGGTGHTMGAFSMQWMWQEYPQSVHRNITMKALIVKSKTLNYITLLYTEKESFKKVVLDRKEITLRN